MTLAEEGEAGAAVHLAFDHHLGEGPDVPGQGVQVRAGGEPGLVIGVKGVRADQQPAGDLAVLGTAAAGGCCR
jgi:hypothetical protein